MSVLGQFANLPRAVYVLAVGTFINRAGTFVLPFLALYLNTHLGHGEKFATLAMGVFGLGAVFAAIIGGQLADTIGRRPVMLSSLLCGSVVLVVFPFLRSQWAILSAIFLFAILAEMYRPAANAMIADLVELRRRTHAYALMYFAINLGFACGALVGGYLATFSYRMLFWGDALTCSVYAVIIVMAIRETLPIRDRGPQGATPAPMQTGASDQDASIPFRVAVSTMFRDGTFMAFCGCSLAIALVYMQSFSTLPLYIDQCGFKASDYGKFISLNGICIVILQIPITALVLKFRRGHVVAAATLLTAIGFGLTGLAFTKLHLAMTVVIWTIGEIMQSPMMPAIVSDLAPERLRARYMGVFSMCFSSANMLGAPIGGWVLATWGGQAVWDLCFVVGTLAALGYFVMRHRLVAKPDSSDPIPAAIILPDTITPT